MLGAAPIETTGLGFGWAAFGALAQAAGSAGTHVAPRAKRVIFLFMDGGVSHVDTFDPKPELDARSGTPAEWKRDDRSQSAGHNRKWLGSRRRSSPSGSTARAASG